MSCSRSRSAITLIGHNPNAFWGLAKKFMDKGYWPCLYVHKVSSVNPAQELRKESGRFNAYTGKYTITENLTEAIAYSQRILVDLENAHYQDLIRHLRAFDLSEHIVEVTRDGQISISTQGDVALFESLVYRPHQQGGFAPAWRPKIIRGANY